MSWQVGDRVICITPGRYYMVACIITGELRPKEYDGPTIPKGVMIHDTDLLSERGPMCTVVGEPHEFRLPPDDSETASWSEIHKLCGWKPKIMEVVK